MSNEGSRVHDLPSFAEIYVISDLHMGGGPGFQMLGRVDRLARFIASLADVRPDEEVALVLNGDIIDSLAEGVGYVATHGAVAMMAGIEARFRAVWDALAGFVATPRRHLVLVSGNHDIELSLPPVERWLRRRLTGGERAREAALTFSTHGAGYACRVGHARVLCTHGNEVDPWNMIDHEQLAQLASVITAGRDLDPERWVPNAGTKLVVDVMNGIKQRYPFVDLLKPEDKLVLPVLSVLAPAAMRRVDLRTSLEIAWRKREGGMATRRLLGHGVAPRSVDDELALLLRGTEPAATTAWLLEAESAIRSGEPLPEPDEDDDGTLGWGSLLFDRILGGDQTTSLRHALRRWLVDDETFALDHRDETFERIVARTGPSVDFVVTGHTHLERAIPFGGRMYYNSGTWARIVGLHEHHLATDDAFRKVLAVLDSGSMDALDRAEVGGAPLVLERSTAVRIASEREGVRGELLRIGDGAGGELTRTPVPRSEHFKP